MICRQILFLFDIKYRFLESWIAHFRIIHYVRSRLKVVFVVLTRTSIFKVVFLDFFDKSLSFGFVTHHLLY
jgi:hypothetical protein